MPEPEPRLLTDVDSLKALAHPLRQQMLAQLQRHGSATSADLAARFGADRGATSYHLRQLARYGFIEEDTGRSAGRRRYWRAIPQDLRLPRGPADPEVAAVADEIGRLWLERSERDLRGYLADRPAFGEFAAAAMHSFGTTVLTAEELARFGEEYMSFLKRWNRTPAEAPADSRTITVVFHAFPAPGAES
ncbi:ArsR/SmtB family transcription factor [Actinoplanes aureus]|uniref:Helix-turn-helix transcriptional regulator n=1 Tax=Actinoplanes aureus TaxID=2792083 RepID=A0A931FZ92_9ACTN|nr:helix-turn-helix domain-containing protein [Actinoplanes aureus]MBG0562741.1 helix-turn-helix transcriptional regulator [Actinoplanes aureus]